MVKIAPEVHYQPWYDHSMVGWYYLVPSAKGDRAVSCGPFSTRELAQASADRLKASGKTDAARHADRRR